MRKNTAHHVGCGVNRLRVLSLFAGIDLKPVKNSGDGHADRDRFASPVPFHHDLGVAR